MKRFTETTKWRDPWFRRLSPTAKLLWGYFTDNCSCIGLIELDLDAARFDIGNPVNEKHLAELSDRVQALGNGKYFIPKFIPFQYGILSMTCPAHNPIFKSIEQHQLIPIQNGYQYPTDRLPNGANAPTGMEEEKERKEGMQGGGEIRSTINGSTVIPEALNNPAFRAVWETWIDHLRLKRKPATLHAQDLQLKKLASFGTEKAIATLKNCIEKNWQGVYESDNSKTTQRVNTRNIGIARPSVGADYGEAAKRKLERQALEAQHREASQAQGNGNGSGPVLHGDVGAPAIGPDAPTGG